MRLKEVCESIRCEAIQLRKTPSFVPCTEMSDEQNLCARPLVSVLMITYNHENYIQAAIEGVVRQKTNFEYELLIGEDCSTDGTFEICKKYQKLYPDKIRLLYSDSNVGGGNNAGRIGIRARGEFLAWCEGDDYWTDENKLQEQIDIMRKYPSVGLCFAQADILDEKSGVCSRWAGNAFPEGLIPSNRFFLWFGFGKSRVPRVHTESFIMTSTVVCRKEYYDKAEKSYEPFTWRLRMGDSTIWLGVSSLSDVYFLKKPVSVYRRNPGGVTSVAGPAVARDGTLIRMYYGERVLGIPAFEVLRHLGSQYAQIMLCVAASMKSDKECAALIEKIKATPQLRAIFNHWRTYPLWLMIRLRLLSNFWLKWGSRIALRLPMRKSLSTAFERFYDEVEK